MSKYFEKKFRAYDGVEIFYTKNIVQNAKAVILIIHGLCEHSGRYNYFTKKLNEFHYGVYRFDNRGHGRSGGERGYLDSFGDFLRDTNQMVDMIREENKDLPIFMFGHSMGGLIAAAYGIKHKNKLNGQILSGAAVLELPGFKSIKGNNYFKSNPRQKLPNKFSYLICRDKKVIKDYNEDLLILREVCFKLLEEAFINGIAWVKENVKDYKYPCLIMHGKKDKVVSSEASAWLYNNISSKDKTLNIYENCFHEIFNEKEEKQQIIEDVHKWIEKRI